MVARRSSSISASWALRPAPAHRSPLGFTQPNIARVPEHARASEACAVRDCGPVWTCMPIGQVLKLDVGASGAAARSALARRTAGASKPRFSTPCKMRCLRLNEE